MRPKAESIQTIAHINTNDIRGGAAKVAWRLQQWQREKGMESNLLVGYKESEQPSVYPFSIDRIDKTRNNSSLLDYDLQGSHRLMDHPVAAAADIIHLHNLHGAYFNPFSLMNLSKVKPICWTLHDMQAFTGHCAYSGTCDRWERGCGQCPDLSAYPSIEEDLTHRMWLDKKYIYERSSMIIITPSKWLKKHVEKSIMGNLRIEMITNGVDRRIFYPRDRKEMRLKYGLPLDRVIIGCVANGGSFGEKRKGGYYVNAAIEHLKQTGIPFYFLNVGGNAVLDETHMRNTGYIQDEQILAEYYNAMDLFLLPSLADNCPLVVSEAQACGIPIVGFNTGGIPELVRDGIEGMMAVRENTKQLISLLDIAVRDSDLRKKLSLNACERAVLEYSHEIVAKKYEKLYEEAISRFPIKRETVLKGLITKKGLPKVLVIHEAIDKPQFDYSGEIVWHKGRITAEQINDSKADIVYFSKEGFIPNKQYLQTMLTHYQGHDITYSHIKVLNPDETMFYSSFSPLIKRNNEEWELELSLNSCLLYKAEFAVCNLEKILTGQKISAVKVVELKYSGITTQLQTCLINKTSQLRAHRLFIYGAGSHTSELLSKVEWDTSILSGIFDKNPSNEGMSINEIRVHNVSRLNEMIAEDGAYLLISSLTYEQEIYDELIEKRRVDPNKIVRMYGDRNLSV